MDSALNNLQRLICHKTKPNQLKLRSKKYKSKPLINKWTNLVSKNLRAKNLTILNQLFNIFQKFFIFIVWYDKLT